MVWPARSSSGSPMSMSCRGHFVSTAALPVVIISRSSGSDFLPTLVRLLEATMRLSWPPGGVRCSPMTFSSGWARAIWSASAWARMSGLGFSCPCARTATARDAAMKSRSRPGIDVLILDALSRNRPEQVGDGLDPPGHAVADGRGLQEQPGFARVRGRVLEGESEGSDAVSRRVPQGEHHAQLRLLQVRNQSGPAFGGDQHVAVLVLLADDVERRRDDGVLLGAGSHPMHARPEEIAVVRQDLVDE